MKKPDFDFRKMDMRDVPAMLQMYKLCLDPNITEEYFSWKYINNPVGNVIGFVAYDKNQIAGFYGVVPEVFKIGGKQRTVYQSMDTMTHPNYQKLGLFTTLAKMTYDYLIEQFGNIYLYGIAGSSSVHGFIHKLNWKLSYLVPYIFLHKNVFKIKSIFKIKHKSILLQETLFSAPDFIYNFNESSSKANIHPHLTKEFLLWRVEKNEHKKYKIISIKDHETSSIRGWCVLSLQTDKRCKIEHLEIGEERESIYMHDLLDFIFETYRVRFIYSWHPVQERRLALYRSHGFITNPFSSGPFSYKSPFITYSNVGIADEMNWFEKDNFDIQPLIQD